MLEIVLTNNRYYSNYHHNTSTDFTKYQVTTAKTQALQEFDRDKFLRLDRAPEGTLRVRNLDELSKMLDSIGIESVSGQILMLNILGRGAEDE